MHMKKSSRQLARTWGYPRHKEFVKILRTSASEWFNEKGYTTLPGRSYCLDSWDNWPHNILLPEVATHISQVKDQCEREGVPFPLHKYIHHGLSSQAMLFNLIGPLVVRNDLEPLRHTTEEVGIKWPSGRVTVKFEHEDREVFNEDIGQPTSIDLVIMDSEDLPKLFIESKFAESEFGGCSIFAAGDCNARNPLRDLSQCYLHHIGRKYWILLEKFRFTDKLATEKQCILASHYQFFRELIFSLEKKGIFILLSDERSPVFHCGINDKNRGLIPFLMEFVPADIKDKIASISIQSLIRTIKESGKHEWIADFEKKYGDPLEGR